MSSLNAWDLKVIAKHRKTRMKAIGRALAERGPDIAVFQEVWSNWGRGAITNQSGLQFGRYFKAKRTIGTGLFFLSKQKIEGSSFVPFSLNGSIICPDSWAGKGVGSYTVVVDKLPVTVFNAHLIARFIPKEDGSDAFTPHRLAEIFEIFAFIVEQTQSDAFLIAGDFNTSLSDIEYKFMKTLMPPTGTFFEEDNNQCTICRENTFHKKDLGQYDYIFLSPKLDFVSAKIDFKELIETKDGQKSLSDHYGLSAQIKKREHPLQERESYEEQLHSSLKKLEIIFADKLNKAKEEERKENQTSGIEDRFCLSCAYESVLEHVHIYIDAIEGRDPKSERAAVIKMRLESYLELFE